MNGLQQQSKLLKKNKILNFNKGIIKIMVDKEKFNKGIAKNQTCLEKKIKYRYLKIKILRKILKNSTRV